MKTTTTQKNNHMGQMIKKAVEERKMPVSDFAKAIHCSRTNVYSIFERESIHIERLTQIINVLKLNVSDFIMTDKNKPQKCVAIIEIDSENLERLSNDYDLTYIKSWNIK
ncbi:MAG: helix-turn-helix domain-containing protein [Bacteroidetes bacterium]|nr:helix-turn-helix domain-containing protein [Bacteroidota bacterium]